MNQWIQCISICRTCVVFSPCRLSWRGPTCAPLTAVLPRSSSQAKKLLSPADYKQFASAIKLYTATRDFPELVSSLAGLLVGTGDQQLQQLFRGEY